MVYKELTDQTDTLNKAMETKFDKFRQKPIKTRHFTPKEKEQTVKILTEFEHSGDEDQVDSESIQLSDANYD